MYVKGKNNNIADFRSRLPFAEGKGAPGTYEPAHGYLTSDPVKSTFVYDKIDRECNVLSHHFYSCVCLGRQAYSRQLLCVGSDSRSIP
jgi:hypothetical protein